MLWYCGVVHRLIIIIMMLRYLVISRSDGQLLGTPRQASRMVSWRFFLNRDPGLILTLILILDSDLILIDWCDCACDCD